MNTPAARPLLDPALLDTLQALQPVVARGRVVQAFGTTLRVSGLRAHIGQQCQRTHHTHGRRTGHIHLPGLPQRRAQHAKAEHQAVVRALDAAKAAGLLHIGLATEPE